MKDSVAAYPPVYQQDSNSWKKKVKALEKLGYCRWYYEQVLRN